MSQQGSTDIRYGGFVAWLFAAAGVLAAANAALNLVWFGLTPNAIMGALTACIWVAALILFRRTYIRIAPDSMSIRAKGL